MTKYSLFLLFILFFQTIGCVSSSYNYNTQILDGTLLQIGLFIPYSGNLYGIQCLNYVSGRSIKINSTNDVISSHSISNKFNTEVYSLEVKK